MPADGPIPKHNRQVKDVQTKHAVNQQKHGSN